MKTIRTAAFFGCACGQPGDPNYDASKNTAKAVAKLGLRVINGGGPGVMHAATEGAKEAGGKTTVVYYAPDKATQFEGKSTINLADTSYEEANFILRIKRLMELADVYIIFNGGTGTISEFGMAWGLARLYFGHHKPFILYGDFWHEIIAAFQKNMKVREESMKVFTIVNSPEQAVAAIEKYDAILSGHRHDHTKCKGEECFLLL